MPRRVAVITLVVFSVLFSNWTRQSAGEGKQTISEGTKPPVVVKTSPQAFINDVDPSLSAITATFDQPMTDKSWSWTGGGETYPKTTGEPSYDPNRTTCSLPVKLEPGKVYWVGINSPSYQNFKSEGSIPAKRYVILFATKDANGNPTPIPDNLLAQAKAINGQSSWEGKQPMSESIRPPVVMTTSPQAFINDVEPSLKAITATFNQTMMDKSWSWTGGGDTYPKTTGEVAYDPNKTTCSLPVSLEPGKVYWVGINSPSYQNFKSEGGVPAKRYVILFATKDANGSPTAISDDLITKAKAINGK